MLKWCSGHAVLIVILTWIGQDFSFIYCYEDLFGGAISELGGVGGELGEGVENLDLLEDLLAKKEEDHEPVTMQDDYYFYSPATLVATRKYRKAQSSEIVLEDMKQKKLFQKAKGARNIAQVLDDLSYDEDYADDENVTMYQQVFSHERTSSTGKPITQTTEKKKILVKGERKTSRGSKTTNTLSEGAVDITHGNTVTILFGYDDKTAEETSDTNSEPKQITSKEGPPYEYLIDVVTNNQTVFRRIYPTPRTVLMDTRSDKNVEDMELWENRCNKSRMSGMESTNKTRLRRIRTTTEYKALRTEKSRYKFQKLKKKYEHLIIGKLPNETLEKEKDCLEKEILHIFTVENMTRYLTELIHYYKHYKNHFNDVVNLVNNVSIFDIDTDNIEDLHNKPMTLDSNTNNNSHNANYEKFSSHLFTPSKTSTFADLHDADGNVFLNNKHLHEKFDLAALNNLFNNEKRVITNDDRVKCDRIYYNLKHILHCLKLNLNLNKYNYINETCIKDLMDIIWKNKVKYDDSDYTSEYEDLYEMCKTLDYYEVSSEDGADHEYHMNEHSGIEDEEPFTRNPETQNVIKEALRNISRIRKERHEFDRGILEGQVKNRCHYCGKNYSSSQEMRYMKHVHNHFLEELDGSNYDENGVYVKEQECWDKAFSYMTKATISTLPTIDIFPYYEGLGSRELDYRFENGNFTTRNFEDLVADKRKRDIKKELLNRNFDAKHKRAERDKDIEDMKRFIKNKDLVTFSDESLPGVIKRYVNKFVNNSNVFLNRTGRKRLFPETPEEEVPKLSNQEPNILGQFEEKKEQQDQYRMNELKRAAHELLKRKDWRSQLNMHQQLTTTDMDVEKREIHMKQIKKVQRKRYQQKLLKEKKQREMQQMWQEDNLNVDKWVFKTNVWTTLVPQ